jgi:IS5 family transposase
VQNGAILHAPLRSSEISAKPALINVQRAIAHRSHKVEHSLGVVKRVFGFAKVRYRGLAKNTHRLWVTCGLANLFIVRHRLLRA